MDKKLKKILDICNKVLTADEVEIYCVNMEYLDKLFPSISLKKHIPSLKKALLNGQKPKDVSETILNCPMFFGKFETFGVCYNYALNEIKELISKDTNEELLNAILDALGDEENSQYNPVRFGNHKYHEFLDNRKEKLSKITKIVKTLDKTK